MSHFVFGIVEGARESVRESISESMQVSWGIASQQAVVIEMLADNGKPTALESPFSFSPPGEDNADALVSPYRLEKSLIIENMCAMLVWIERERGGRGAELWVTEGYDDAFSEVAGSYQQILEKVRTSLQNAENVPSLRVRWR